MAGDRALNLQQLMAALNGSPSYLGTITATTTAQSNASTGTPFTIPAGSLLILQGDAPFYFKAGVAATSAPTAASTDSLYVDQQVAQTVILTGLQDRVSCVASTGTVNVRVFNLV